MNQAPNNQGNNNTFSSQQASPTNPFTADLKSEFSSNFGTNTNAVSQIFKEGGFANNSRMKYYIIAAVLVVAAAAGFYIYTETQSADDAKLAPPPIAAIPKVAQKPAEVVEAVDDAADDAAEDAPAAAIPGGVVKLATPASGSAVNYDETQRSAKFSWEGTGGTIVFSRAASMTPEVLRAKVSGTSFSFANPWPGKWFWRVENESGASEVRSFSVSAPTRRNIALTAPAAGATLAGTGGEVNWQGDSNVARYKVELTTAEWANPNFVFSSSGSKLQLNAVTAGKYKMRLGAFSEVSGRWEFTQPQDITVQ